MDHGREIFQVNCIACQKHYILILILVGACDKQENGFARNEFLPPSSNSHDLVQLKEENLQLRERYILNLNYAFICGLFEHLVK